MSTESIDSADLQHPKPERRLQALRELPPDQGEPHETLRILSRLDEHPEVRIAATELLADGWCLVELLKDPDVRIVDAARKRLSWLFDRDTHPSLAPSAWHSQRMELIVAAVEADSLHAVSLVKSRHEGVAAKALQYIKTQQDLVEAALNARNPEIRKQAVMQIHDVEILKNLQSNQRGHDKVVYRSAHERLQEIARVKSRYQELDAKVIELIVAVEAHAQSRDPILYLQKLEYLEQQGNAALALLQEAVERILELHQPLQEKRPQALEKRLKSAIVRSLATHSALQSEKSTRDPAEEAPRTETGVMAAQERLDALARAALDAHDADIEQATAEFQEQCTILEARWQRQEPVSSAHDPEKKDIHHEFLQRMRLLQAALVRYRKIRTDFSTLSSMSISAAEIDSAPDDKLPELWQLCKRNHRLSDAIAHKIRQLQWPEDWVPPDMPGIMRQQLKSHEAAQKLVITRLELFQRDAETRLGHLKTRIDSGEIGNLSAIQEELDKIGRILRKMERDQLQNVRHHHDALIDNIAKYKGWKIYAIRQHQETLCEQMEALVETQLAPPELAIKIQDLQAKWKEFNQTSAAPRAWWTRFSNAAEQAYRPCREYFARQNELRKINLGKREKICTELEALLTEHEQGKPNWKAMHAASNTARKKWRKFSPANQKKELAKRFETALERLDELLAPEYQYNLQRKRNLLHAAKTLVDSKDELSRKIASLKELQGRWQKTGVTPRREGDQIWNEFRQTCDTVFTEWKAMQTQKSKQQQAVRKTAHDIVNDLESRLREWDSMPAEELGKTLNPHAVHIAEQSLGKLKELPAWKLREIRRKLSGYREQLTRLDTKAHKHRTLHLRDAAMQALEELLAKHPPEPQTLAAGAFAASDMAAVIQARSDTSEQETSPEAETTWRRTCVRMEIFSAMESPATDRELRTQIRTEHLVQKFREGDHPEETPDTLLKATLSLPLLDPETASRYMERLREALGRALEKCTAQTVPGKS